MKFKPKKNLEEAGISVYQKDINFVNLTVQKIGNEHFVKVTVKEKNNQVTAMTDLSLIHISETTRRKPISYAVLCL